jgi:hypothetical protein
MEADLQSRAAMSPETEPAGQPERSPEFIAFTNLVDTLLSVSRAELQKKMQREVPVESEQTAQA